MLVIVCMLEFAGEAGISNEVSQKYKFYMELLKMASCIIEFGSGRGKVNQDFLVKI